MEYWAEAPGTRLGPGCAKKSKGVEAMVWVTYFLTLSPEDLIIMLPCSHQDINRDFERKERERMPSTKPCSGSLHNSSSAWPEVSFSSAVQTLRMGLFQTVHGPQAFSSFFLSEKHRY